MEKELDAIYKKYKLKKSVFIFQTAEQMSGGVFNVVGNSDKNEAAFTKSISKVFSIFGMEPQGINKSLEWVDTQLVKDKIEVLTTTVLDELLYKGLSKEDAARLEAVKKDKHRFVLEKKYQKASDCREEEKVLIAKASSGNKAFHELCSDIDRIRKSTKKSEIKSILNKYFKK